jgi:hypothetical protein
MGVVPNNGHEDRLIALAQGVKGVKSVTSRLTSQLKLSLCCDYRGDNVGNSLGRDLAQPKRDR